MTTSSQSPQAKVDSREDETAMGPQGSMDAVWIDVPFRQFLGGTAPITGQ
jgi:hypothetical protein